MHDPNDDRDDVTGDTTSGDDDGALRWEANHCGLFILSGTRVKPLAPRHIMLVW